MKKKRENLLVATIMGGDYGKPSYRERLYCRKDERGLYRWYNENGEDTEVYGKTLEEAKQACSDAWGIDFDLLLNHSCLSPLTMLYCQLRNKLAEIIICGRGSLTKQLSQASAHGYSLLYPTFKQVIR